MLFLNKFNKLNGMTESNVYKDAVF